jgi:hypothetical protein
MFILPPCSRVLLEKLTGFQQVKKSPAFYATRKFITAFKSARHLSLSWARSIQSISPHPTSWRSILLLSFHLSLGLPSSLFHSGFPTKTLYKPGLFPIRATCPTHLILLDFITRTMLRCYMILNLNKLANSQYGEKFVETSDMNAALNIPRVNSTLLVPSYPRNSIWIPFRIIHLS